MPEPRICDIYARLRRNLALTIYSFVPRVFGGALPVAPAGVFRLSNRLFATMAIEIPSGAPAHSINMNGRKTKLHGRAFYESIGSPKLILAPMVEQSEFVCL